MKILIPLDGSPFSQEAVYAARRLFTPADGSITLLRVAEFPNDETPMSPSRFRSYLAELRTQHDPRQAEALEQALRDLRAGLLDQLAEPKQLLREAGFQVSCRVLYGQPALEIASLVRDEGFDLVIMATHGRKGLARLVMGSVAEAVLRQVRVPVVMIRPPALIDRELKGAAHDALRHP